MRQIGFCLSMAAIPIYSHQYVLHTAVLVLLCSQLCNIFFYRLFSILIFIKVNLVQVYFPPTVDKLYLKVIDSLSSEYYFPTLYCTFLGAPASTILPTSAKSLNKNSR